MEVCKPSEVVDFGVDDDPLQRTVSDGSCSDEETCQVASLVVLRFDRRSVRTTYEAKSTLIYLCNLIEGELLALGRHSDRLNLWSELQPGALTCCQWGGICGIRLTTVTSWDKHVKLAGELHPDKCCNKY